MDTTKDFLHSLECLELHYMFYIYQVSKNMISLYVKRSQLLWLQYDGAFSAKNNKVKWFGNYMVFNYI